MSENSKTLPENQINRISKQTIIQQKGVVTVAGKENTNAVTVLHCKPVSAKGQGELASLTRKSHRVRPWVSEISSDVWKNRRENKCDWKLFFSSYYQLNEVESDLTKLARTTTLDSETAFKYSSEQLSSVSLSKVWADRNGGTSLRSK